LLPPLKTKRFQAGIGIKKHSTRRFRTSRQWVVV
jgi:hypothetical protein